MRSPDHGHSTDSVEDDLHFRLTAYGRYMALVRAQEEALEAGDLERHARLGEEREEIQSQLGEAPSREELAQASKDPEARALLEGTLAGLRAAMARDERMRKTLDGLRREIAGSIRAMGDRKGQVHKYLERQQTGEGRTAPRVNRKG